MLRCVAGRRVWGRCDVVIEIDCVNILKVSGFSLVACALACVRACVRSSARARAFALSAADADDVCALLCARVAIKTHASDAVGHVAACGRVCLSPMRRKLLSQTN